MTESETAVREALAKMTPGTLANIDPEVCDISVDGEGWVDGYNVNGWGVLGVPDDPSLAIAVVDLGGVNDFDDEKMDAWLAGIVALKNHTPALLAELDAARAENARLREALKPFADAANIERPATHVTTFVYVRDLHRARAALEASHD